MKRLKTILTIIFFVLMIFLLDNNVYAIKNEGKSYVKATITGKTSTCNIVKYNINNSESLYAYIDDTVSIGDIIEITIHHEISGIKELYDVTASFENATKLIEVIKKEWNGSGTNEVETTIRVKITDDYGNLNLKEYYITVGMTDGSKGDAVTIWFNNVIENKEDKDLYGEPGTYSVFDKNTDNGKHDMAFYKIVKRGNSAKYKIIPNGKKITLTERNNGNGQTYTDNKLKIQITNPFAPKEGEEDQRNICISLKGFIYPVKKDLSDFGSEYHTAIGDATSCKNGNAKDEHYVADAFRDKGYTIRFDDFLAEFMTKNYTDVMHRKDFTQIKFVFDKIDPNVDSEFKIFLRGRNKSVHFATVEYKLQTWFEENHQKKLNLRKLELEDNEKWKSATENYIKNLGFQIDKNPFDNVESYKHSAVVEGINTDRARKGTEQYVFELTATKDVNKVDEYGKNARSRKISKGKKYKITISTTHYLMKERIFYFAMTIDDVEDTSDDAGSQSNIDGTEDESKVIIRATNLQSGKGEDRKPTGEFHDVLENINYFKPTDETVSKVVTDKASIILTSITNVGMVVAVLMLAILGIKYMLGSVEEKADYKKDLIPYLIGAGLLFGICTIVSVLQKFGETINNI